MAGNDWGAMLSTEVREPILASESISSARPATAVFWAMLRKHLYIARKRRRLCTALWPVCMYCSMVAALSMVFADIHDREARAMTFALLVPTYLLFAIQGAHQCVVVELVSEKESKMKILQEIYGLSVPMYWLSWGAYFVIVSAICIICMYFFLCVASKVIAHAYAPLLIFILLVSYAQQFAFAAILSVFFDRQQTASSVAGLVNLFMTLMAALLQAWLGGKSKVTCYLAGLLPYTNIFNGISAMMWLEVGYVCKHGDCSQGLTLSHLWESEICFLPHDPCDASGARKFFPAGDSILLMVFNVVLYCFLAWWLENVWQGEYGTAKPPLFCLNCRYFCPRRSNLNAGPVGHASGVLETELIAGLAAGGTDGVEAIAIKNLRKVFADGKVAVDDLTLNVYAGELFALLGHNGAGKTTAINCVVGLVTPTGGEASVGGFSVARELGDVRRQLSVCPQDNPMYDVFTVSQHLEFFASLRGVAPDHVAHRVDEVLAVLCMPEKKEELCSTLSGGQKRRLWVATALIGHSPTMFLDEPTSGMDPLSRQNLWHLWRSMKQDGRTVIFTTHYLEEADRIADRKAVLAKGRVQAVGTSRDLKQQFGIKYHLEVEMQPEANEEQSAALTSLVLQQIPTAQFGCGAQDAALKDTSQLAKFTLPVDEVPKFAPLLMDLEDRKPSLGVKNYTIGMTTLEEVFMALGRQAEQEAGCDDNGDFWEVPVDAPLSASRQTGVSERRSTRAMARVRLICFLKNRRAICSATLLPIVMNVIAFATQPTDGQDVNYNLAMYPPMAFGISTVTFTLSVIFDRQLKIKYVLHAQGMTTRSYWLGTLAAHYAVSLPIALSIPLLIFIFEPHGLYGNGLPLIILQSLIAPVGMLLYAYSFAFLFTTTEMAVKLLPLSNLLLGTVPTLCVTALLQAAEEIPVLKGAADIIHVIMSIVNPVYSFPGTLVLVMSTGVLDEAEKMTTFDYFRSLCAVPLYCSLLSFLLYGAFLLWRDARERLTHPGAVQACSEHWKDDDVQAEEARVLHAAAWPTSGEAACCQGLHHTYDGTSCCNACCGCSSSCSWLCRGKTQDTHAVRGISLGIHQGECFGLLGPNGAGKTTALALLTGELRPPSAGKVFVQGHDLAEEGGLAEAYKLLGVCPQVDPLWESLSGDQHLYLHGRIKGIPEDSLRSAVEDMLRRLGMDPRDSRKTTGIMSGGMKRKLSLGMALMGHSPLLFLDEPSAAVDAGAKRHMWKVIKNRGPDQTVVVTTHSMEEAEALCDRIAIQVKGQLRCLGSPIHIKNKYGTGYQLELICHAQFAQADVIAFVQSEIASAAQLLEHDALRYLFQLPPMDGSSLSLGMVFSVLQRSSSAHGIAEYSVTQPSLEQVFIRFAREQDEPEAGHQDASSEMESGCNHVINRQELQSFSQLPLLSS